MRIGHGYDAHRFCEGKQLRLGGVDIDYPLGLLAHSDGDVVIHAMIDALLGGAGEGDIGKLYPDTDKTYAGIDSRILLRDTVSRLAEKDLQIDYMDVTIIAQKPKMAPHIEIMKTVLAEDMGISPERLNIKATTEEKMGFTGREEGIRTHAVCLLKE
ncbi:MAG: 2-C-methyl-D-erythritol 2,4-cyclodiphosphate synthase [Clostridia bacterium]|nr:2-C-methyl-D-erythritol 2,4-cyclodiphosphate synthase [Clostridia bacterium]